MIAKAGPEAVDGTSAAIAALVIAYEGAVKLADVIVDGVGTTFGVVVIAKGDDEIRVPPGDQRRNPSFA